MRGLTSPRPSALLAYIALAAIGLQIALSLSAPEFAAWSPAHAHITLDGRDHVHVHLWDRLAPGVEGRIPGHEADNHSQSEPAPSRDLGVAGAAVALPVAAMLLGIASVMILARVVAVPTPMDAALLPATPPPRG